MGYFSERRKRTLAGRRDKTWWEIAADFESPAQKPMLYDPMESGYDPLGSYTGTPADGGEPQQDADDL